jgi:hypothetical protein
MYITLSEQAQKCKIRTKAIPLAHKYFPDLVQEIQSNVRKGGGGESRLMGPQ